MGFSLDDYVDVAERIAQFYEKHPEGRLTTVRWELVTTGAGEFLFCHGQAWRSPEDTFPGDGYAWEPIPGKTPYTKDSELMNAQTAAWGRAIVATGILASKKIASAQEVKARQAAPQTTAQPLPERYVDWLRLAIRSRDTKELADEVAWKRDIDAASTPEQKQAMVERLEALAADLDVNVEAIRERWQANKVKLEQASA